MSITEKIMVKSYKDLNIQDKKRNENHFGAFQNAVFEFLCTLEQKERNHISFNRVLESIMSKAELVYKNYKQEEKTFVSGIQKIAKDVIN